jgi:hypothetical protein
LAGMNLQKLFCQRRSAQQGYRSSVAKVHP